MLKKYSKSFIITLFLGILFIYTSNLYAQTYGLQFKGQDVTLDKRTELNLTPNEFLKFQDEFEISFDYKLDFKTRNSLFGYVFRIISQENNNVDLISNPNPDAPLNLVVGKSNSIVNINYPEDALNSWINLRIKFLLSEDRMIFYAADTFYVHDKIGFEKQDAFKIIFGANDYGQFKTTDVPSMNIKNVKLFEKGKLQYHWLLDVKDGEIANDRLKNQQASIRNPKWLMNSHQTWQSEFEIEINGLLIPAFDEKNERIFMVGKDELHIYSVGGNEPSIKYKNKPEFITNSYNAIYNSKDKKIYCYLADESPFYSLNIETGEWNETSSFSAIETKYRHHNRYYNPSDNSIYLFGGYGQHKYKNEISKIDLNKNTWNRLETNSSIFRPRYLAGLGFMNDTLYIFGGYGSESGNQLINPQSFYDLFGYSIKDGSLFKKFDVPRIIDDMTVANSMWIDKDTREYFALVYEKTKFDGYLQLIKGNLDSPEIEMLGNKIPFKFLDVRSYASLFYMPEQKKLIAYTSYTSDSTTQAAIYSISYPPNLFVDQPAAKKESKGFLSLYFAILLILLTSVVVWTILRLKKKNKRREELNREQNKLLAEIEPETADLVIEDPKYQMIFFGGFQVYNKDFEDITSKFSPLLKELYLLIVLNTFKNNKGVSSDKITEILWYDKSEKSARNNRAVNIAKLRVIMSEVGACELTKKTGYWKIIPDDRKITSDYLDFLNITSSKNNLTKSKINRLINISQKGAFLLNVHYDWLDEFKASVSDIIVDTLIKYGESCDLKKEAEFIIHLADSVFNFDVVNEEAMILKCRAEYHLGKHSLAKASYERFFKEYRKMYNQEYGQSFLKTLQIQE